MATRYIDTEPDTPFRVMCDSCALGRQFRTEHIANMAADLHELMMPLHNTFVAVRDDKAPED